MRQTGTIGIVGGGQLGRMLTEAATPLGFKVIVVDPNDDCPAKQVGAEQIKADFYHAAAIRKLSERSDYLTVETEHVNTEVLKELADAGAPVNPAPTTIATIQDKYAQKVFLQEAGVPVADFTALNGQESAELALEKFGGKMLIKARHGAYDGRGNMVVESAEEIAEALRLLSGELYAEKFIPFAKELAVMVARDVHGNVACYPLTETLHERNICIETFTPAEIDEAVARLAEEVALATAKHLKGAGVFGIEMFLTEHGKVLVNEIAPRVHNSGHYTIEACETSQFEQHVRAITGMELGPTALKVPTAVMINILGERDGPTEIKGLKDAEAVPGVTVHLYGKSPTKIDRKMGHITAVADSLKEARERAEQARKLIDV